MKRSNHTWTAERRKHQAATLAAKRQGINGVIDLGPSPDPEIGRMLQALRLMRSLSDPARNYVLSRAAEGEGVD